MFQQRQINDIYQLVEVSFSGTVSPGAITTGSKAVVTVACVVGGAGNTSPATFALGDDLEVIAPSAAGATGGLIIQANPTSTPGTCTIAFFNASGGTITLTSSTGWVIFAKRVTPQLI